MTRLPPAPYHISHRDILEPGNFHKILTVMDANDQPIATIAERPEANAVCDAVRALPELISHLQRLIRAIDRQPGDCPLSGLGDEARAALARALPAAEVRR